VQSTVLPILLKSSSSTSEVASKRVARRFRPVRSTAPRVPGGGFVQGPCDSLDIYGDAVTVSSGGTNVRLAMPDV